MWLCTKLGFYSIVQKRDGFHVRARTKRDLENLCSAAKISPKIEDWPTADYRWRVRLDDMTDMNLVFDALMASITYQNFKSEVYSRPDQTQKRNIYNRLWQSMADLQEEDYEQERRHRRRTEAAGSSETGV